jgi:2-keto-4-pentenoate hydratase/2-oxohepta-3-ene-1,7-dioic acid hydratase in catechol pathway
MHSVIRDGKPVEPTKIVCIGRNYAEHIKEFDNEASQEPCIFLKPNSSISHEVIASDAELIHYEGEISFLIEAGKLRAVGFGLDLTKRDLQYELKNRGWPWERAKAFDNAAVFSEFVSYEGDTRDLRLEFYINDELIQFGDYALMLSKPEQLLADCKTFMTFEDGDLLMTGTPRGVGPVKRGDQYVGKILTNDTLLVEGAWTVK